MPYVDLNKKYKTHINDKDMMTPLCISYVFFFQNTRARAHAGWQARTIFSVLSSFMTKKGGRGGRIRHKQ